MRRANGIIGKAVASSTIQPVNELGWHNSDVCLSLVGGIREDNSALVPRCLELSCPLCAQPGSTFDMSCPQLS